MVMMSSNVLDRNNSSRTCSIIQRIAYRVARREPPYVMQKNEILAQNQYELFGLVYPKELTLDVKFGPKEVSLGQGLVRRKV